MKLKQGGAFELDKGDPAPKFLVVSIWDEEKPGPKWLGGTSLQSFSKLVKLDENNYDNANFKTITAAWSWMRDELAGRSNVQDYYLRDPFPVPVLKLVELSGGTYALLVHAPDFSKIKTPIDRINEVLLHKYISLLRSIYRTVRELCAFVGGAAEAARMAPLSAGKFAGEFRDMALEICVDELVTRTSAPITVYGWNAEEYNALCRLEYARVDYLGLDHRSACKKPSKGVTRATRASTSVAGTRISTRGSIAGGGGGATRRPATPQGKTTTSRRRVTTTTTRGTKKVSP